MNWYDKSKEKSKVAKPYKIYRTARGIDKYLGISVEAYSSEQARFMALKEHDWLNDYLQMGYEIEARIDEEEVERRKNINKFEQDKVDSAWWNK